MCQFFSFWALRRTPAEWHYRGGRRGAEWWHPEQGAQNSPLLCFIRWDLHPGTEGRAVDWQKVFITQTARRQQSKDQGLLKQGTAVPRELHPSQRALARNSSHAIAVFCCGQFPKPRLKVVKYSTPPHVMISQSGKSRREGCKNN